MLIGGVGSQKATDEYISSMLRQEHLAEGVYTPYIVVPETIQSADQARKTEQRG